MVVAGQSLQASVVVAPPMSIITIGVNQSGTFRHCGAHGSGQGWRYENIASSARLTFGGVDNYGSGGLFGDSADYDTRILRIGATVSGSGGTLKYYLDGQKFGSDITVGTYVPSSTPLDFGDARNALVLVYNRELSAYEVLQLSLNPWQIFEPPRFPIYVPAGGGSPGAIQGAGAIAGAEAFGTAELELNLAGLGGIAGAEAFGTAAAKQNLQGLTGITSGEAFGTAGVLLNVSGLGGIATVEAFGTPSARLNAASLGGVGSGEVWGDAEFAAEEEGAIQSAGDIPSAEGFGTDTLLLNAVGLGGIGSGETWGNAALAAEQEGAIQNAGDISSAEAFGTDRLLLNAFGLGGIASGEAWGADAVRLNAALGGISSGEIWGSGNFDVISQLAGLGAVASLEFWGVPQIAVVGVPAFSKITASVARVGRISGGVQVVSPINASISQG